MEHTKFKIGETSKLVGLSPETIRYYERKNIIQPPKDDNSGYRQFDILDVCILSKARNYLHFGFSLEEAHQLLCADSIESIYSRLQEKECSIQQNIDRELMRLRGLQQKLSDISYVQNNLGQISLQQRPNILYFETFQNSRPVRAQGNCVLSPPLFEHQTLVFPYLEFPLDTTADRKIGIGPCNVGLALWESDADHLEESDRKQLSLLPSVPCLRIPVAMKSSDDHAKVLQPIPDHLFQLGITPADSLFCRTVTVLREQDSFLYYRDVWIPVSPACKI